MYVLPKSPSAELWDGPRTGVDGVKEIFGADEAYDNTRFPSHLKKILSSAKHIFMDNPGTMPTLITNEATKKLIETGTFSSFFIPASWNKKRMVFSQKGVFMGRKKKSFFRLRLGLWENRLIV
jgi:intermediate cleaving peptidase 55